jgi:hypothetical protein
MLCVKPFFYLLLLFSLQVVRVTTFGIAKKKKKKKKMKVIKKEYSEAKYINI